MTSNAVGGGAIRRSPPISSARTRGRGAVGRTRGAATIRAAAFVAARRADAESIGGELAELIPDPDALAHALRAGFTRLADPNYLATQQRIAPGIGPLIGVRWPLQSAVARGFGAASREDRASTLLFVADRLLREETLELRWFAFGILDRTIAADPERTWQLLRRAGREAGDWITVDTLARPFGRGILLDRRRWAELEQLVFSPSGWERRLVASTIAAIPNLDRAAGRHPDVTAAALPLLGQLIGDAEPEVQKALAWAYRTLARISPDMTARALESETERAVAGSDGHRALVVRNALATLEPATADRLRLRLSGVPRVPGAPSTSVAAEMAARFSDLGLGRRLAEPPLQ